MKSARPSTSFAFLLGALTLISAACSRDEKPSPTPEGPLQQELALAGAVLIGTGDIGVCDTGGDEVTGALVDSLLLADSTRNVETFVATFGDNAYPSGSRGVVNYFGRCFSPSWGRPRIMRVIRPAPGNHDYDSGSGDPYFEYFGSRAGPPGKGYYSYNVSGWHILSLNSELYYEDVDPDLVRAQEDWVKEDLAQHKTACALAYWHRPYFSSGTYGTAQRMKRLWTLLYESGVDLVLNGHEHDYERFLPQTPEGVADSVRGMAQIVVGTGGAALRAFRSQLARNSAAHIQGRLGVIKVTLGPNEYRHAFIDTDGRVWDVGGRRCH